MNELEKLAAFAYECAFEDLSAETLLRLKIHILDSLACAIAAQDKKPILMLKTVVDELGGNPQATLIGGLKNSVTNACLYNSALVRYLDFNDSYLAKGETCHPSDNLASVLAAAEYVDADGKSFLTALALAYEVQRRLSDSAPVRKHGFDHSTHGAYSVACAAARVMKLDKEKIANAIAISATANNILRVARTGSISHFKGLAFPFMAQSAINAVFLAREGISGPHQVFEGKKGFMESIAGKFSIDWQNKKLDAVHSTIIKKYNAEIHSQSAIEGCLQLKEKNAIKFKDIRKIEIDIFDVAYNIIGGGDEGNKHHVFNKETADHSLPYLLAVALIDNEVGPEQFKLSRIIKEDVQCLLQKIVVREDPAFSKKFPGKMPVRIKLLCKGKRSFELVKEDYDGFLTRPLSWAGVIQKFKKLAGAFCSADARESLIECVYNLEKHPVSALTSLLSSPNLAGKESFEPDPDFAAAFQEAKNYERKQKGISIYPHE